MLWRQRLKAKQKSAGTALSSQELQLEPKGRKRTADDMVTAKGRTTRDGTGTGLTKRGAKIAPEQSTKKLACKNPQMQAKVLSTSLNTYERGLAL
jgi:hypothetical protein